jgi:hypothetical protein
VNTEQVVLLLLLLLLLVYTIAVAGAFLKSGTHVFKQLYYDLQRIKHKTHYIH